MAGSFTEILFPNTDYTLTPSPLPPLHSPGTPHPPSAPSPVRREREYPMGEGNRRADNRWAVYRGRSNGSGAVTDLGPLILDPFGGPFIDPVWSRPSLYPREIPSLATGPGSPWA